MPTAVRLLDRTPLGLQDLKEDSVLQNLAIQIARFCALDVPHVIVYRVNPLPVLFALGYFEKEHISRLQKVANSIYWRASNLSYVTYRDAEEACRLLADQILRVLGSKKVEQAAFFGVPRGGLIVLGMLSYELDLDSNQVGPSSEREIAVVVDDCALSGNRLGRFLRTLEDGQVLLATLFSNQNLRSAVCRSEDNVLDFVSAHELEDFSHLREDQDEWRQQWISRDIGKRYWLGTVSPVAFAWGDPDNARWNSVTEQMERGPSVVPPASCLKTRYQEWSRDEYSQVKLQPSAKGPIKPPGSVVFGEVGESTIVANPEADVCIELEDTGAAIWHAMIKLGRRDDIVDSLLKDYDIDRTSLTSHVDRFLRHLEKNNLLTLECDA